MVVALGNEMNTIDKSSYVRIVAGHKVAADQEM